MSEITARLATPAGFAEIVRDDFPTLHPGSEHSHSRLSRWARIADSTANDGEHRAGNNNSPGNDEYHKGNRICHYRCPARFLDRLALCRDGLHRTGTRPGMKPFLNVFREFNEIDLRNSRFGFNHDPVRFDAVDRGIFVYLALDGFEVLSQPE